MVPHAGFQPGRDRAGGCTGRRGADRAGDGRAQMIRRWRVIGSHIRSMQAEHLTDVLTSDQHTVKPWLSARLDVSPPVRDLKDEGFPLVGGRLDYVDGHPAAAVVYRRAKHVINLFAWASPGKPTKRSARRRGRGSTSSPGGTTASNTMRCPMWRPISWCNSRNWWRKDEQTEARGAAGDDVGIQAQRQAVTHKYFQQRPERRIRAFFLDQERRINLARGVVHRHHQVERRSLRQPPVPRGVLVQLIPGNGRRGRLRRCAPRRSAFGSKFRLCRNAFVQL